MIPAITGALTGLAVLIAIIIAFQIKAERKRRGEFSCGCRRRVQ